MPGRPSRLALEPSAAARWLAALVLIVSGKFAGDTAIEQVVFVTPNTLQCLTTPGLTKLGPGPAVLTIARI